MGGEEPSQLAVCEETKVRRVPRRLELVQRGGLAGLVGRELVDDEYAAARPRHACELGDHALGSRDVMERPMGSSEVELAVREFQRFSVSFDEVRVREGTCPRELDQLRHRIDPEDLTHERCERERERPSSGADVKSAFVTARIDVLVHFLRETRGSAILPGSDALRRAREPVSR